MSFLNQNIHLIRRITEPIIIILAGLIIGRILGKVTKKLLFDFKFKSKVKIHRIGENVVKYIIYILAVIFAIRNLGIEDTVLSIIIVFGVSIFLLLLSLNLLDFIFNFTSYFYVKKTFKKGDKIELEKISGVIKKISLTRTEIKLKDDILIVPNFFMKENQPK
ncbi:MAG: mechanosensitive ion channel [Candidatus Woesearchaeota archaeon]|nr:MAG: mechanosensitive ion channel [Candidatus Woesearchaeota archaeon]